MSKSLKKKNNKDHSLERSSNSVVWNANLDTKKVRVVQIISWIGHILRGEDHVKKEIEGRMEGKRGKSRIMMLDDIVTMIHTYENIKRRAMLDRI